MKIGDRVIVISENAKHYNQRGIIKTITGNELLILFDNFPHCVMYYVWNVSLLESNFKEQPKHELYMLFDNAGRKYGKNCKSLKSVTDEAKSVIKDGQTLYIFKCVGEVNSKIIKTTNSVIY